MHVHIVGGGIIGLASALYLRRAGAEVTVVERGQLDDNCSFGNAGLVAPSHFVPLASPGVISKGLRWMLSSKSPFYIHPRLDFDLIRWLWLFFRSSRSPRVAEAMPLLRDFNMMSKELYAELASLPGMDFAFEANGLLMIYNTAKGEAGELALAETARRLGLDVEVWDRDRTAAAAGALAESVRGAVYYADDAHLHPARLMRQLRRYLEGQGVRFLLGEEVRRFELADGRVRRLHTASGRHIEVEEVVVAAGAWTGRLLHPLGVRLPMQGAKGYSVTLTQPPQRPSLPLILTEAKVAITPMGDELRIGGTLELAGFDDRINRPRVEGVMESIRPYLPQLPLPDLAKEEVWRGFRPCTPDGLPYLGRLAAAPNVTVAAGHAMVGLSLGAATGKLVSELVTRQQPSLPLDMFRPERFG